MKKDEIGFILYEPEAARPVYPPADRKPQHSAFEGPCIGTVYPKGTAVKNNPDGTCELILPDENR